MIEIHIGVREPDDEASYQGPFLAPSVPRIGETVVLEEGKPQAVTEVAYDFSHGIAIVRVVLAPTPTPYDIDALLG